MQQTISRFPPVVLWIALALALTVAMTAGTLFATGTFTGGKEISLPSGDSGKASSTSAEGSSGAVTGLNIPLGSAKYGFGDGMMRPRYADYPEGKIPQAKMEENRNFPLAIVGSLILGAMNKGSCQYKTPTKYYQHTGEVSVQHLSWCIPEVAEQGQKTQIRKLLTGAGIPKDGWISSVQEASRIAPGYKYNKELTHAEDFQGSWEAVILVIAYPDFETANAKGSSYEDASAAALVFSGQDNHLTGVRLLPMEEWYKSPSGFRWANSKD